MNYYALIVDTTAYSGNFEREMTAYMTGILGNSGVGDNFVQMFNEEVKDITFENIIYLKMDDEYGVRTPCDIAVTPGYVNNGMGKQVLADSDEAKTFTCKCPAYQSVAIYFNEDPSEHIAFLKNRAYEFEKVYNTTKFCGYLPSEKITVINFRLVKTETTTEEVDV